MTDITFNEKDVEQIKSRGITPEKVKSQIEIFKKGFPFVKLKRPCTVGDGITVIQKGELKRLTEVYSQAALSGRAMKFVPASGAASRMWKLLLSFDNSYESIDAERIASQAANGDPDSKSFLHFIENIRNFAFYDDLKSVMLRDGLDIESLLSRGQYKNILEHILTAKGLDYADLPKGLIKFHRYPDHSRTPFEEHLVEAAAYVKDRDGVARIHFTISPEHEEAIKNHIERVRDRYEKSGVKYEITFSYQKPSADTVAVDLENNPFRDAEGKLIFRPGGHGALLENLNELEGDIIFIKNIDNVVPDRLKGETYLYKRVLGGLLVELQKQIFQYLDRISKGDLDELLVEGIIEFASDRLCIVLPKRIEQGTREEKVDFLFSKLNRPLRVCGIVKNEGEPGGGPFWVEHADGTVSMQIVESSQVNMKSAEQKEIWESSTHFNPVDLVCGVCDYLGKPFNLMNFIDPETGFISTKSYDGRELKALELPGLWNGGMANWNTVFVEVSIITFNPVKTVFDLLRKERQPV
ncbi:MAG TPA: DUF4301 family protein [Thermodesulfobacteriota bacterium]|nr:DUF4301 family protein [Thermodesulfobacteriota bacterium]